LTVATVRGTRSQDLLDVVADHFPMLLDSRAAESVRQIANALEPRTDPLDETEWTRVESAPFLPNTASAVGKQV